MKLQTISKEASPDHRVGSELLAHYVTCSSMVQAGNRRHPLGRLCLASDKLLAHQPLPRSNLPRTTSQDERRITRTNTYQIPTRHINLETSDRPPSINCACISGDPSYYYNQRAHELSDPSRNSQPRGCWVPNNSLGVPRDRASAHQLHRTAQNRTALRLPATTVFAPSASRFI